MVQVYVGFQHNNIYSYTCVCMYMYIVHIILEVAKQQVCMSVLYVTYIPKVQRSLNFQRSSCSAHAALQLLCTCTCTLYNLWACIYMHLYTCTCCRITTSKYSCTYVYMCTLHAANLPPHFATSQVTSVRKQLKVHVPM